MYLCQHICMYKNITSACLNALCRVCSRTLVFYISIHVSVHVRTHVNMYLYVCIHIHTHAHIDANPQRTKFTIIRGKYARPADCMHVNILVYM